MSDFIRNNEEAKVMNQDLSGRWYCTGDGVGEQVAARSKKRKQQVIRESCSYRYRHRTVSSVGNGAVNRKDLRMSGANPESAGKSCY